MAAISFETCSCVPDMSNRALTHPICGKAHKKCPSKIPRLPEIIIPNRSHKLQDIRNFECCRNVFLPLACFMWLLTKHQDSQLGLTKHSIVKGNWQVLQPCSGTQKRHDADVWFDKTVSAVKVMQQLPEQLLKSILLNKPDECAT